MICNKIAMYRELWSGGFGNTLQTWSNVQDYLSSSFRGRVSLRAKQRSSTRKFFAQTRSQVEERIRTGDSLSDLVVNEATPDNKLTIQGEICILDDKGLTLFYCTDPNIAMPEAMRRGRQVSGVTASYLLRQFVDASSLEDIYLLLEQHPGSVVEFSSYSCYVGTLPRRNTIIWEVRNY